MPSIDVNPKVLHGTNVDTKTVQNYIKRACPCKTHSWHKHQFKCGLNTNANLNSMLGTNVKYMHRMCYMNTTPKLRNECMNGMGWGGMGWDGMGWDGMGWDGMGWDEMGWDGMGWDGMGWDGMGWDGMGWDGMGWDGMGWDVLFCFGWDGMGWDGTGWDGVVWDGMESPIPSLDYTLTCLHF